MYDYVSLPAQRYDFISETVTHGNLTQYRWTKEPIIAGYFSNLVASKLLPVGHHHKSLIN